jgi:hypothetical protein
VLCWSDDPSTVPRNIWFLRSRRKCSFVLLMFPFLLVKLLCSSLLLYVVSKEADIVGDLTYGQTSSPSVQSLRESKPLVHELLEAYKKRLRIHAKRLQGCQSFHPFVFQFVVKAARAARPSNNTRTAECSNMFSKLPKEKALLSFDSIYRVRQTSVYCI